MLQETQLPSELPPHSMRCSPPKHVPHELQLPEPAMVLYRPSGQGKQIPGALPAQPLRYSPGGQSSHTLQIPDPTLSLKVPETHGAQLPAELAPQFNRYSPNGHPMHVLQLSEPEVALYLPEMQPAQLPTERAVNPGSHAQSLAVELPTGDDEPEGQLEQPVEPPEDCVLRQLVSPEGLLLSTVPSRTV